VLERTLGRETPAQEAGMQNRVKTVKKSTHWWKHGKHKGALVHCINENKALENKKKPPIKMYDSIEKLMKKEK